MDVDLSLQWCKRSSSLADTVHNFEWGGPKRVNRHKKKRELHIELEVEAGHKYSIMPAYHSCSIDMPYGLSFYTKQPCTISFVKQ